MTSKHYSEFTHEQLGNLMDSLMKQSARSLENGEIWSAIDLLDEANIVGIYRTIKYAENLFHDKYKQLAKYEALGPIPEHAKVDFVEFLDKFDLTVSQDGGWLIDLCGRTIAVTIASGEPYHDTLDRYNSQAPAAKHILEDKYR